MSDTRDASPSPRPNAPATPPEPRTAAGNDAPAGRYDANVRLIRCRLTDEDRMKAKRRRRSP